MVRSSSYGLALTLLMTGLAASPVVAQTAPANAEASRPSNTEPARSATQAPYATQTSDREIERAEKPRARAQTPGHSRTAKAVWRDRHHLPNAK